MKRTFTGLLGLSLLFSFAAVESGCKQRMIVGVIGSGGAGGSGGSGGEAPCPGLRGPAMVRISTPGGSYCIDTTEVTQAQYAEFLDSSPEADPSSVLCSYKTTFVPGHEPSDGNQMGPSPTTCHPGNDYFDPTGTPALPVVCVDWCDAAAYCAWAGKRLCGHSGGGAATADDYADADTDEWYRACSNAGASQYPYGASFAQGTCSDGASPQAVGAASGCHGTAAPFDRIFDMSGNVAEWEDNCHDIHGQDPDAGAPGYPPACYIRGGGAGYLTNDPLTQQRFGCVPHDGGVLMDDYNVERPQTGIRCCAD